MVDKSRILVMLENLKKYHQELLNLLPSTLKEYTLNLEKKRACERTAQLLIEECIDISNTLLRDLDLGLPEDDESIFEKLSQRGVLSEELTKKLQEMKKFRNILVHKYAKIDDTLAYENLKENHHDFKIFREEVLGFLKDDEEKRLKKQK